ncbi:UNC93-like protein [Vanrija pseudolonga]|uniref:UNC93-like protein n=1 Tax=Vanrija pseudolonga TaxID=143232 RepID=A0AAF0Y7I6_9TREE|nr:UNC93-like protein [Vanrija pseudolonga]
MSKAEAKEDGGLTPVKRVWYRSPFLAAVILGLCNFCAPGLWGAMNSLGAGGQQTPWLINAGNALTFCLMILTAFLSSTITDRVGVNFALFLGGVGFAPYCAALYCNNVFGTRWFVLLGAATCGLSAGLFWGIEAAVAISYPERYNMGKFLGIWLSLCTAGSILGGAINLGLNATNDNAGAVNPKVYLIFVSLASAGPFLAFLLPKPHQVQRSDGKAVRLYRNTPLLTELLVTLKLLFTRDYLLLVPLVVQAVFPESYTFTFIASHFTVRARALGSFLAAVTRIIAANLLGRFLDARTVSLKNRARWTFIFLMATRGGWWIWSTILSVHFPTTEPIDWNSPYFGRTFALYIFLNITFQTHYLFLYFLIKNFVRRVDDETRAAGLLRAVESASQAVAYGTSSVRSFALLGSSSLNFGLWGISIIPAWLVVRRIGVDYFGAEDADDNEEEVRGVVEDHRVAELEK